MRTPLIAGNWKMNGSRAMADKLVAAVADSAASSADVEVVLCPPATLLHSVSEAIRDIGVDIKVGAQDIDTHESGAFTGQVSAALVKDAGASFTIVGHSERRSLYAESDETVTQKTTAALNAGLTPILCVGETQAEREAGETHQIVSRQLAAVLGQTGISGFANIIIAYEPVWAIGTGLTATPGQAQEVHALLRSQLASRDGEVASSCRILYGGSMKPDNAASLLTQPDIDGGLVGGASLTAPDFISICKAAAHAH